jgi:hypothetical protein
MKSIIRAITPAFLVPLAGVLALVLLAGVSATTILYCSFLMRSLHRNAVDGTELTDGFRVNGQSKDAVNIIDELVQAC